MKEKQQKPEGDGTTFFKQAVTPNVRRTHPENKSASKKDLGFCFLKDFAKKGQPVSK